MFKNEGIIIKKIELFISRYEIFGQLLFNPVVAFGTNELRQLSMLLTMPFKAAFEPLYATKDRNSTVLLA